MRCPFHPGTAPLALASIVPAMVASPRTAKMTGYCPITRSVMPLATCRLCARRITTCGPPAAVCAAGPLTSGHLPQQLVSQVCVVESKVCVVLQSKLTFSE